VEEYVNQRPLSPLM